MGLHISESVDAQVDMPVNAPIVNDNFMAAIQGKVNEVSFDKG